MSIEQQIESLRAKLIKIAGGNDLKSLAQDRHMEGEKSRSQGLESADTSGSGGETLDGFAASDVDMRAERSASALAKVTNGDFEDISQREVRELEAIVEKKGRPVSFIRNNGFDDLPHPWTHYNDPDGPIRRSIANAIPFIGRVELPSRTPSRLPRHLATAFVVGSDLVMTNRHVAELFVRGIGADRERLRFVRGSEIHFGREKDFEKEQITAGCEISGVKMVHPYWDMALLCVSNLPTLSSGLPLSISTPEELYGRDIAVIGYPGPGADRSDIARELEREHFQGIFGVKRLAPGEIRERQRVESFDHLVNAMVHDSSTLPGNSGSAVLDVNSGEVVGLHFGGITLKANYSVPTFELARDRRVVDAGLNFQGTALPTDAWDRFWSLADAEVVSPSALNTVRFLRQDAHITQKSGADLTIPLTISIRLGE